MSDFNKHTIYLQKFNNYIRCITDIFLKRYYLGYKKTYKLVHRKKLKRFFDTLDISKPAKQELQALSPASPNGIAVK